MLVNRSPNEEFHKCPNALALFFFLVMAEGVLIKQAVKNNRYQKMNTRKLMAMINATHNYTTYTTIDIFRLRSQDPEIMFNHEDP